MLLCIPEVLTKEQVAHCRQTMDRAEWVDGRATAGAQSGSVKRNMQLPEDRLRRKELGDMVLGALSRSPLFISAAIPQRIFPMKVSPMPPPWRRMTMPWKTWTRERVPSMTLTWTLTVSPARNSGTSERSEAALRRQTCA